MSLNTVPVFVVGSGRCGTAMIAKLLGDSKNIEVHHEYFHTYIQQLAVLYYMGCQNKDEVKRKIESLHVAGIYYSTARYWIDCSNKISWIVEPLFELLPNLKIVHLVRDGRKVVSSFYHKRKHLIYDEENMKIIQKWRQNKTVLPMPPPEERYWWVIPHNGQPFAKEFPSFSQFQRICYFWSEINRVILESLENIPEGQKLFIRLEDIISNKDSLRKLLDFLEIKYDEHYFEEIQRPHNVIFPEDFKLTDEQLGQFYKIGGKMMHKLGYGNSEEYRVRY